jgi:hypothetical protein
MATFGRTLAYQFSSPRKLKETRKSLRKSMGAKAWIRLDGGFSVRPCVVADLSDTGVRIVIDAPETIAGIFSLLMSRNAGSGQRCRVKWRRGSQIGAEFL